MSKTTIRTKYAQVRHFLLEQIRQKRLPLGTPIPSESRLVGDLGVSRVTVRRAVRELTKEGILESRPGIGHVVRSHQKEATVGLLFGRNSGDAEEVPFHRFCFAEVERILGENKYNWRIYLMHTSSNVYASERVRLMDDIRRGLLSGLISAAWPRVIDPKAAAQDRELIDFFKAESLPYVGIAERGVPAGVGMDYGHLGYAGTRHFLNAGCKRIALMAGGSGEADIVDGYQKALSQAGQPLRDGLICRLGQGLSKQAGYETLKKLFSLSEPPEAIVIADDFLAQGVMLAVLELGINVPQQLQIATLYIKGQEMFFPRPFVKLQIDPKAFAKQAATCLFEQIRDTSYVPRRQHVLLKPVVIPNGAGGASTDSPPWTNYDRPDGVVPDK